MREMDACKRRIKSANSGTNGSSLEVADLISNVARLMRRQCCRAQQGQARVFHHRHHRPLSPGINHLHIDQGEGGCGWENTNFPDLQLRQSDKSRLRLSPRSGLSFHHSSNRACRSDSQIFNPPPQTRANTCELHHGPRGHDNIVASEPSIIT